MAEAARAGRTARWMLLFCTLLGLATMHTLGHAGMHMDTRSHASGMPIAGPAVVAAGTAAFGDVMEHAVAAPCHDGTCGGSHDSRMSGWGICLAVLGGVAVVALLAALLLGRVRGRAAHLPGPAETGPCAPRAPPRRPAGLTTASTAVLRI